MPYGMKGGDTPKTDLKMELCVKALMQKGHDKVSAIKICKASIDGTRRA